MIFQALAFYLFGGILALSALLVVTARNPVHSVLFLILAFFSAAGLFVLLGAEFIAMILVIVYVGAVAVLFLFVVMMLDVNFEDMRKGAVKYVGVGILTGVVLLTEMTFMYAAWAFSPDAPRVAASPTPAYAANSEALGHILYTHYFLPFQIAGLVLLVAMIGAIVLTHRTRPGVRRQSVARQNARTASEAMEIRKVETGAGV